MAFSFVFDIRKAIAATAFLAEREDGKLDMFLSIKMLYLADKMALQSWGKTITGDKMVSMPKGPVLSVVYNLFKGIGTAEHLKEWNSYFGETVENKIQLQRNADLGSISEEEAEILEEARNEIHKYAPWTVAKWLHDTCPEWEDPHGSSFPIDPKVILRNYGRSEKEIEMLEKSANTFKQIDHLFNHLAGR